MRIISIGPAYPLRGGIAKFNESFAKSLSESGHEVSIYSYKYQYPPILFPGKTQFVKDAVVPPVPIQSLVHSLSIFSWQKTAKLVLKANPDLLVIHYWMPFFAPAMGYIAKQVKKQRNIRIILLAHNLLPHEKQPGSRILTSFLLKHVDALVSLSGAVRNDALNIRKDLPAMVLHHPVYDIYGDMPDRYIAVKKLGLKEDYCYLLFFGLVRKYKGLDILLRAVKYFEEKKIIVLIAGEFYDAVEEYRQIIDEDGIEDKVIIRNEFIPDEKVGDYFSVADLVVQPYRTATQSGVAQIAFHFERPMIVTPVGGLPEIIDHGKSGYIAQPEPKAIAEAVNDFYSANRKAEMVQHVREKKSNFSWESFTERFTKFVKEIK